MKFTQDIVQRVNEIDHTLENISSYLNREFDVKKLKLKEEYIERRVRQILANNLLELISQDIDNLSSKRQNLYKLQAKVSLKGIIIFFVFLTIVGAFIVRNLSPDFTSFKPEGKSKISESVVLICRSPNAYAYHIYYCRGLNQCTHNIESVKESEAKAMGRKPCNNCY